MAEKKEIKDMDIQELRDELKLYCSRCRNCRVCALSILHHTGDEAADHPAFEGLNSRFMLDTLVALARGYLEWKHSYIDPNDPTVDHEKPGPDTSKRPTVPPELEPVEPVKTVERVESIEAKVSELSVNMPDDMTVIMISGKKPTSMTVFYDQEGGGADGA